MRKLELPGRSRNMPRLEDQDIKLIRELGINKVKEQAEQIVRIKLVEPEEKPHSVPRAGNPVYKAMHACRASSRKDLHLAHSIPRDKKLTDSHIDSIVNLLTRWIAREYNFYREETRAEQKELADF